MFLLILLCILNISGGTFRSFIFVEKTTEPIEIIFSLLFIFSVILFLFKEKIGLSLIMFLLVLCFFMQVSIYFRNSFDDYYKFFSNTHRIFPESNNFLVKDTYHILLDILIGFSLLFGFTYTIQLLIKNKSVKTK